MAKAIDGFRAGGGEPLVLVHGAEASWTVWRPVLAQLTPHYDVRAIVLPGHNGGEPLDAPISLEMFADSLEAYLDAEGLEKAHFCGNSLGGVMAAEMVRRGRASSAVSLCGPSAVAGDAEIQKLLRMFKLINVIRRITPLLAAIGKRSPWFRKKMMAGGMVHAERMTRSEFTEMMDDPIKAEIIAVPLVMSVINNGFLDPMDVGSVPLIIAWGEQDKTVTVEGFGRPTAKLFTGSEFRLIPDAGHIPMWDDPAAVVDAIRDASARVVH